MSLKEEIEKIEEEERLLEEEDARQIELEGIDEKIAGLYLRIDIIVEYIDKLANAEEETNESEEAEEQKKTGLGLGKRIGDV